MSLLWAWLLVCLAGLLVNVLPFLLTSPPSKGTIFFLELFQLDRESNIPTWFSGALLLLNAVLLAVLASGPGGSRLRWGVLSGVFVLLSVDEIASLHEASGRFASRLTFGGDGQSFFWVALAVPLLLLLYLYFHRLLFSLPVRTRNLIFLAAAIYVGGALGVEVIGWIYTVSGTEVWAIYLGLTFIEETAEMLGQIIFAFALLDYLANLGFRMGFEAEEGRDS